MRNQTPPLPPGGMINCWDFGPPYPLLPRQHCCARIQEMCLEFYRNIFWLAAKVALVAKWVKIGENDISRSTMTHRGRYAGKKKLKNKVEYQQLAAALLHPKLLVSFPRIPFPETVKVRIRDSSFVREKNSWRTCHYEVKCHKAYWLGTREALWSNCKQTHSSKSIFFLWRNYEIWTKKQLRVLLN